MRGLTKGSLFRTGSGPDAAYPHDFSLLQVGDSCWWPRIRVIRVVQFAAHAGEGVESNAPHGFLTRMHGLIKDSVFRTGSGPDATKPCNPCEIRVVQLAVHTREGMERDKGEVTSCSVNQATIAEKSHVELSTT